MITIKEVTNGFIVKIPDSQKEGYNDLVVEIDDSVKGEVEAIRKVLWLIIEQLHPYSKHNKYNVKVEIEHTNKGD